MGYQEEKDGGQEYLRKAEEISRPVYAYNTKIMRQDIPYIGIDNVKAGRELAECMAEELGYQGKVGIVTGNLKQTAHEERMEGFRSYIQESQDTISGMRRYGIL